MLTFFVLIALGLSAFVVTSAIAIPVLTIGAVCWFILLPFRLLFDLVFGVGSALFGLAVAPLVLIVVAVTLIGAVITTVMTLFAPLLPLAFLALLVWGIYQLTVRRPTPVL